MFTRSKEWTWHWVPKYRPNREVSTLLFFIPLMGWHLNLSQQKALIHCYESVAVTDLHWTLSSALKFRWNTHSHMFHPSSVTVFYYIMLNFLSPFFAIQRNFHPSRAALHSCWHRPRRRKCTYWKLSYGPIVLRNVSITQTLFHGFLPSPAGVDTLLL